jgi:DNA-binding response OmpR family regulator
MSESALVVLSGAAAAAQEQVVRALESAGYAVRSEAPQAVEPSAVVSLAAQVAEIVQQCIGYVAPTALLVVEPGTSAAAKVLSFPLLTILVDRRQTLVAGEEMVLTKGEFNLLRLLATHPGRAFSREELVVHSRGIGYPVTERSIDVQITGLRKKLGAASHCIQTIRGVGYRFDPEA